jgi:hypothetical protein
MPAAVNLYLIDTLGKWSTMTGDYSVKAGSEILLDDTFAALSHAYRRRILSLLARHGPEARFEIGDPIRASDNQNIEITLHHNHLPKLDRIGFIEWDREANTIGRGFHFEEIKPVLELLIEHQEELPDEWA